MSRVYLIAADKPLPFCDRREERSRTFGGYTISCLSGFCVSEHSYYRSCVDGLALTMKPYQYELALERHEGDLAALRAYLAENFAAGESVELWSIWVGDEPARPVRHRGRLADFDMDTLEQFLSAEGICMTIVV